MNTASLGVEHQKIVLLHHSQLKLRKSFFFFFGESVVENLESQISKIHSKGVFIFSLLNKRGRGGR